MRRSIVGLGQLGLGNDVGHAVIDELEKRRLAGDVELRRLDHPVLLVPLLRSRARVVVVDGLIGSPAGRVLALSPGHVAPAAPFTPAPAFGVAEAVDLARALEGGAALPDLQIVLVTVPKASPLGCAPDPRVRSAITVAADRALALVRPKVGPSDDEGVAHTSGVRLGVRPAFPCER